mmetsp:Transcript_21215/g.38728  ORF Transcript_21215/g.38728 Transcript_21215/m.38728 type:complete len:98 (+) Transcript_21215:170-463(+)
MATSADSTTARVTLDCADDGDCLPGKRALRVLCTRLWVSTAPTKQQACHRQQQTRQAAIIYLRQSLAFLGLRGPMISLMAMFGPTAAALLGHQAQMA